MNIEIDITYYAVMGAYCTVREIVDSLKVLKSLGFEERYDLYSELFREDWPTDAGYVLLSGLWGEVDKVECLVDFELVYVIGLIQRSIIADGGSGDYAELAIPFARGECLKKVIPLLELGLPYCNPSLTEDNVKTVIAVLVSHIDDL